MQAAVPLVFEFQLNGRIELTVLGTGLHLGNLTPTVDLVGINGVDFDPSVCDAGLLAAAEAAILALVQDTKAVPA